MTRISKVVWLTSVLAGLAACGDGDDDVTGADASCDGGCGAMDAGSADAAEPDEDDAAAEEDAAATEDAGLDAGTGTQAVSIRFKAKLGDRDLVCGQNYAGLGTTQVTATPQDFRFYVQEVRLVRKGTKQEERVAFDVAPPFQRAEVALIDFTDAKGSCGGSGRSVVNTTIRGRVPVGEYDGIVFVNGVPAELNHAGPAETAGPPLDDVTLFWGWLNGYRFIIAELLTVTDHDAGAHDAGVHDAGDAGDAGGHDAGGGDAGDHDAGSAHDAGAHDAGDAGGHAPSAAAFLHMGSTACGGSPAGGFNCARKARNEIRLSGFDPATDTVVADLAAVFKTSDLNEPLPCHGIAPVCAAPYAAFGVDMDTGTAISTQQVFRVE